MTLYFSKCFAALICSVTLISSHAQDKNSSAKAIDNIDRMNVYKKDDFLSLLYNDGYALGAVIWPKHRLECSDFNHVPGLTKLTIKDASYENGKYKDRPDWFVYLEDEDKNICRYKASSRGIYSGLPVSISKEYPVGAKKWSKNALRLIKSQKIEIGMTRDQVMASWGFPNDMKSTRTKYGENEQWVYGKFPSVIYVYFENGKLDAIQD